MKQVIIKDPWKKLQMKRERKINKLISNAIKENTEKVKLERKILDNFQEMVLRETNSNLTAKKGSNHYENQMPYILVGLVESIFVDEKNMQKLKEVGIGILIQSNIVLVSAKNLVFDNKSLNSEEGLNANFQLFEVDLSLINVSEKYKQYIPSKIKVKDYYTPLDFSNENISEEDRILNGWGLIVLDFPIGEFIKYIIEEANITHSYDLGKKYNPQNAPQLNSEVFSIKHLNNKDIEASDIFFLEGSETQAQETSEGESSLDSYSFSENYYEMKFDDNLIFLNSLDGAEKEILPGIILAQHNRQYYLIGMNTNIILKVSDDAEQNQNERTHRIAVRFTKNIFSLISNKIAEIKLNNSTNSSLFSCKLFRTFDKLLSTKEKLKDLIRDNCKRLIELVNNLKNEKNLSNDEKQMLSIFPEFRLKELEGKKKMERSDKNNGDFILFVFTLIWHKHMNLNFESNAIEADSLNIGIDPGTKLIANVLKTVDSLVTLNLKSNQLFSKGLKNIIKPIFNTKQIFCVGKELRFIHLDSNKLSSKGMKYLRHLLKVCPQLMSLTLNNNYITDDGLKHLINALNGKEQLIQFSMSFNMLGPKSGKYLAQIFKESKNIKEIDIQSNNLTDESIVHIVNALKLNSSLNTLYLGNNNLNIKSCVYLADLLMNNQNLISLWLNNNNLTGEGVKLIAQSLVGGEESENENSNCAVLFELNLNSVNMGPFGAEYLFEAIKRNRNLKRLYLNSNSLGDVGCEKIGMYLHFQNEKNDSDQLENTNLLGLTHLSLSDNQISDLGARFLVDFLINYRTLQELKLNSNLISDEGGELLLYSILHNNSIVKFNIENNLISWRENNLNIKNFRNNIQIFF